MVLEFEVENLVNKGKIGSALKLIAIELDKIPTCKLSALLNEKKKETDLEDSLAQAHHRLDTAWENINQLNNRFEDLLK